MTCKLVGWSRVAARRCVTRKWANAVRCHCLGTASIQSPEQFTAVSCRASGMLPPFVDVHAVMRSTYGWRLEPDCFSSTICSLIRSGCRLSGGLRNIG